MGLPAPWLIGLVLLCVVLAAIPTRRLSDAGIRPGWLAAYMVALVILGVAVVAARGPGRFVVPFLVVLYLAPLVVAPETTARWLGRGRRPPKHVGSGPGRDVAPDDATPGADNLEPGPGDHHTPRLDNHPTPGADHPVPGADHAAAGPGDEPVPGPGDDPAP